MKEFIEKLISRLEEEYINCFTTGDYKYNNAIDKTIAIVNQLAKESSAFECHSNEGGYCEWEYDEFEDGWQTSCGTTFSLCDSDKEVTHFCPCCGKKIKVV